MNKKKIIAIWSSVTVGLLLCTMLLVNMIMKTIVETTAPAYLKYAAKFGPIMYHNDPNSEEMSQKIPGVLKTRAILSDTFQSLATEESDDLSWMDRLIGNYEATYTYRFLCNDVEEKNISSGSWTTVFRIDPSQLEEDDRLSRMDLKTTFAILDVEKAIQQGYGQELQTAIHDGPDISIRIDAYALKELELIPMHITVLKEDLVLQEYAPNTAADIPDGFEIIQNDEVWLYHRTYQSIPSSLIDIDLSNEKEMQRLRRISEKTAASLDFEHPEINTEYDTYQKVSTTPFTTTVINHGVLRPEGSESLYALVMVYSINNLRMFLILSLYSIVPWTILFAIIVFAFRKRA